MKLADLKSRLEALKPLLKHVEANPVKYEVNGDTTEDEQQFIALHQGAISLLSDILADDITVDAPQFTSLSDERYPGFDKLDSESYDEYYSRTEVILNDLLKKSSELSEDQIVDAVVSFAKADGQAFYLVTKDSPIVLQHLPVGDAWEADDSTIRGLTRDDILMQVRRQRYLKTLKPAK